MRGRELDLSPLDAGVTGELHASAELPQCSVSLAVELLPASAPVVVFACVALVSPTLSASPFESGLPGEGLGGAGGGASGRSSGA